MLDLDNLDVDDIAAALPDQNDHDHRWLLDRGLIPSDAARAFMADHPDPGLH